jgi:hypothetical protein
MSAERLSRLQKFILTTAAGRPGTGRPLHCGSGSPSRADAMARDILGEKPTPSARAALSRAMRRLESRGLIEVCHWALARDAGIDLTNTGRQMVNTVLAGYHNTHFERERREARP